MPYAVYSADGRLVAQDFPDRTSAKIFAARSVPGARVVTHREARGQ